MKYRLDDESLREGKFRIDENTGILFTRIGFEEDVGLSYSLTVRESIFSISMLKSLLDTEGLFSRC